MLIRLEDVKKHYRLGETVVPALDGVSLEIGVGEFVAVVGRSGSGKSTLMNLIGCLDQPTSGEYWLEEKLVSSLDDRTVSAVRGKKIGFVFQGFNLIPSLSALENVELPLVYRRIPAAKRRRMAAKALADVGLADRAKHRPHQLSGGQQQRTAIARAIAGNPPIILADEPTGNLDSASGKEVMDILCDLNRRGHTVILITHSDEIADMAKRIVTVQDGRILSDRPRVPALFVPSPSL